MVQKNKVLWVFISIFILNTVFRVYHYLGLGADLRLYYQLSSFVLLFLLGVWQYRELFRKDLSNMIRWKNLYLIPCFYFLDLVVAFAVSMIQFFLVNTFQLAEGVNNTQALSRIVDLLPLPLFLLIIGIVIPVVEEIFYRKWLLDQCKRILPIWVAILLQGLLFGLVHGTSLAPEEIIGTLPHMASGIFAGYLYHKTDNLYYPIILHCLNNLFVQY